MSHSSFKKAQAQFERSSEKRDEDTFSEESLASPSAQPVASKSIKLQDNSSTFKKTVALLRGMRDSSNLAATIDTSNMSLKSNKKVRPDQAQIKMNSRAILKPLNLGS